MTKNNDELELPDRPDHTPTEYLIRLHTRGMGCCDWNRNKYLRLARACNETIYELGARIGLARSEVDRRLDANKFRTTEGILLEQLWRFVQYLNTGEQPEGDLFYPHNGRLLNSQVKGPDQREAGSDIHIGSAERSGSDKDQIKVSEE